MTEKAWPKLAYGGLALVFSLGLGACDTKTTSTTAANAAQSGAKTVPTDVSGMSIEDGFNAGFKRQFTISFKENCENGAVRSGARVDSAAQVCGCTADALTAKYKPEELMAMQPEAAMPVMKECAEKLGY